MLEEVRNRKVFVYVQKYKQREYQNAGYVQWEMRSPHQSISIKNDRKFVPKTHRVSTAIHYSFFWVAEMKLISAPRSIAV